MALKTIRKLSPTHKLLQDYLTFLPDLDLLHQDNREELKKKFEDNIKPLITIAANNGFEYMKSSITMK